MSLTGAGPDDPHQVGRADRATCWPGCTARSGCWPRCCERERTGRGQVVRTSLLAGDRRRARLPGHPVDGRRRGARAAGQPPPVDRPYGLFHCRRRGGPDRGRQRGAVAAALRRRSGWTRPTAGSRPTPSGCATATRSSPRVDAAFADVAAEPLLARLAAAGMPAGQVRTLDEVYAWEQTRSQGLLIDVEHPTLGPLDAARAAAAVRRRRRPRPAHRAADAGPARRVDPGLAGRHRGPRGGRRPPPAAVRIRRPHEHRRPRPGLRPHPRLHCGRGHARASAPTPAVTPAPPRRPVHLRARSAPWRSPRCCPPGAAAAPAAERRRPPRSPCSSSCTAPGCRPARRSTGCGTGGCT